MNRSNIILFLNRKLSNFRRFCDEDGRPGLVVMGDDS